MSTFQRLLNMASKALDKRGQSSSNGSGNADWREMVRTVADRVTGDGSRPPVVVVPRASAVDSPARHATQAATPEDRAAIARYEYLLSTAQPAQLEQVNRDAFARLTSAQREQVGTELRAALPTGEHPASSSADDLARSATRGEAQNPGFLKKLLAKNSGRGAGGALAGAGLGAVAGVGLGAAGGLLAAVAGGAVLSTVAGPLLEQAAGLGIDFESLSGGLDGLSGGIEGVSGGLESLAGGAGEYTTGLTEQASDLGFNFDIPGLSGLGDLFNRN